MRILQQHQPSIFNGLDHILQDAMSLFQQNYIEQEAHQLFVTPEGWAIRIDLPGYEKSDIKLHVEDHALHLVASQPETTENRRPDSEHRFALGDEVSLRDISAKLEHGVLEILLPRQEVQNETHTIEII